MSVLHSELLNFTGSLCGIKMTSNEASMESKISHVWTVVKEANNNLNACGRFLEHYSSRAQFGESASLQDASTQTSLPSQMSNSTQTYVPSSVHLVAQTYSPYVDSLIHVTTQTNSDQSEDTNIRTQTCVPKDNIVQMHVEQEVRSVGLQAQSCGCSLLNMEFEKNAGECWSQYRGQGLCHEHYKALQLCGNCEFGELEDNKTMQTIESMDTKVLQGHQKIVKCFSSLEQHCQDMDVRLRSVLSLFEVLGREMQSSISRVFDHKAGHEQHNKEKGTNSEEVPATDKQHRQTAEELLSVLQSSYAHSSGQEMQVLNRRLVQLEETLAAERDNVLQLHKNGALLYAQIKNIKCILVKERVSKDSLSHQTACLNQKNSRLRAQLFHSRAQYRSQLAHARRMLGSRNAKVNQLKAALIKVRDLCQSIDSSYRTMLLEIGKQLQLTAELLARNCDLEWSQGSAITTMTATDLKELYQHIWHTTKWIQMHILARQHDLQQSLQAEGSETNKVSEILPTQCPTVGTFTSLNNVKTNTSSPPGVANSSDLSFDLELNLDMSNTVQPAAKHSVGLTSTTFSSLSQDLSWQHEAPEGGYQMQHKLLTILDNLKVKLLQLKSSSVQ